MMDKFSSLSIEITKNFSKEDKKRDGIYFTPNGIIMNNLKGIDFGGIFKILEPSCGSCEYITIINRLYPKKDIVGIEYNKEIYDKIKELESDKIKIKNANFLEYEDKNKYDLIIGNPPYYVMKKADVDKKYNKYYDGRPNIFILFIIKSIELLEKDGILSFILPKNFINCLYYNKTRRYIANNFKILDIIDCKNDFKDTEQETIIMIIKNRIPIENENERFVINIKDYLVYTNKENNNKLKELYLNSKSLAELNFRVNVGSVIWNECKDILSEDNSKTRLIYSSDIKNNKLELVKYKNELKKNYINKDGYNMPLLVINRGYGVGSYNFTYCLINVDYEYLIENHLICISYNGEMGKSELINAYNKMIDSFNDSRTEEFIKLYFGNSAINTTELNNILPIYDM